ncbi:MAG: heparan-alpha-glucosaminide N-acetyltransferase domain-containing protein [Candidatus Kapaibacteriales bacterium]
MESTLTQTAKKHRYLFIDVLRGIAVLWMIETHVVDVVLAPSFKSGWFYNLLNIFNGFVALTFLFCAGAGFWIAATRKSDDYRAFRKPLFDYLRRLGLILAIAYWLHFPTMSLQRVFSLTDERWISFFQCDILQTIVYTSLLSLLLLLLVKDLNALKWVYGILSLAIFLLAPFVWEIKPFAILPPFFGALFAKPPISKFPLFPWSGYFFAGAFVTALFFQSDNKKSLSMFLTLCGFAFLLIIYFTRDYTNFYFGYRDWWRVSPFHSIFRVSGTIAVFGLLFLLEEWLKDKKIAKILQLAGQESLFIYVSHLLVVYGSIANFGMKYVVGSRLGPFETSLIILGLIFLCQISASIWHRIKSADIRSARWMIAGTFGFFFLIFLLNPA